MWHIYRFGCSFAYCMSTDLLQTFYTLDTIDDVARQFWAAARNYRLFAFSGDMGAGKTTFISHLCRLLQVEDAVSSPTFALVNEYRFPLPGKSEETIFHIDLYRLADIQEAINAGMEDCVARARNNSAYCFIEWPEKAMELFSKPYVWVSMELTDPGVRKMTLTLIS